jgi:hypothetical protein
MGLGFVFQSSPDAPLWAGKRKNIALSRRRIARVKDDSIDRAMIVSQAVDANPKRYQCCQLKTGPRVCDSILL